MNHKIIFLWTFLLHLPFAVVENTVLKDEDEGFDESSADHTTTRGMIKYNMRKNLDLDQEGCYLQTGKKACLEECGFNATAKTIFIIHGWTMSGIYEAWMYKLVSAVMQRENEANVVIVDWIPLAQQLYPDAVNHTLAVGLDIANMLDWLQVCMGNNPPQPPKIMVLVTDA
ncbi:hypothetical protein GOODEAATRI_001741 [Goodea atripinnis]|uniref:Lipase domain-containing protein n=1 Tax=Goodea atripinnis TaxID=208336 RepID=A0ABV0P0P6_9TELE